MTIDWQKASEVATTIGGAVAGVGAIIALLTYRAQVEGAAEGHMHALFRDLMNANLASGPERRSYRMNTLRLYILEEVFDSIHDQQRDLRLWGWLRPFRRTARRKELAAWLQTVKSHLNGEMRLRVAQHPECYGPEFIAFVDREAPPPDRGVDPTGPEGE